MTGCASRATVITYQTRKSLRFTSHHISCGQLESLHIVTLLAAGLYVEIHSLKEPSPSSANDQDRSQVSLGLAKSSVPGHSLPWVWQKNYYTAKAWHTGQVSLAFFRRPGPMQCSTLDPVICYKNNLLLSHLSLAQAVCFLPSSP